MPEQRMVLGAGRFYFNLLCCSISKHKKIHWTMLKPPDKEQQVLPSKHSRHSQELISGKQNLETEKLQTP